MTYATLRPGWRRLSKATRDEAEERARQVEAAAARHEPGLRLILVEAFRRLSLSMDAVFWARSSAGDVDGALEGLALSELREALADGMVEQLDDAYAAAGRKASSVWQPDFADLVDDLDDIGFSSRTESALRQVRQRSGTLITEIGTDARNSIRLALQEAVERGDNPRVAARSVRPLVGNLERHAKAVEKFRARLIKAGNLGRDKIDDAAARYASRLLKHRTEMIARTEMLWSANAAQHEYWVQLRGKGLISQSARRVWMVTEDERTCEQCAPLDGEVVGFDDSFVSDQLGRPGEHLRARPGGAVISEFPPLHPNCRCVISLEQ